jgi:hypothetical protein
LSRDQRTIARMVRPEWRRGTSPQPPSMRAIRWTSEVAGAHGVGERVHPSRPLLVDRVAHPWRRMQRDCDVIGLASVRGARGDVIPRRPDRSSLRTVRAPHQSTHPSTGRVQSIGASPTAPASSAACSRRSRGLHRPQSHPKFAR